MKIEINLTKAQLKGLRDFAEDWAHWHLDDAKMTDEQAVIVCVLHTAVGPKHPNEVGACGAQPAEIDDEDLVKAMRKIVKRAAGVLPGGEG